MSEAAFDVAIVGAGPTGLTLANALGQAGLACLLVERRATTVREPRAVSIDDESLRTMQAIGLAEAVTADCALDYGSHYVTRAGRRFATVAPATREYGFPRRSAFTQPKLESTLREGLRRFPHVEVLFGQACEGIEEDAAGVALALSGTDGASRRARAAYLVGCDGARSGLRKTIGAELTGSTYVQPWLIVDLAATRERLRQTRVVCDPARPFITLPGPGGIRRYEFLLHPGEDEATAVAPDFVRSLLAASGPDADMPVVRRQVYTFHARVTDRWRRGRVLIAGDAAHLSPPFAGQGMNSGIRDAQNLAWKLAAVVQGRLGEGLLDTYQVEREPHARALIALAIRMGQVMMPTSALQAWLVQTAFRLMRVAPRLRDHVAQMKYKPKPFYREGFVAGEGASIGRMLPQPLVERADRSRVPLDTLLGPGFALLAHGPDAQAALAAAAGLEFGLPVAARVAVLPRDLNPDPAGPHRDEAVRDVAGGLVPFLPADRTTVLLVRPDRYVAAAGAMADLDRFAAAVRALVAGCGPAQAYRPSFPWPAGNPDSPPDRTRRPAA